MGIGLSGALGLEERAELGTPRKEADAGTPTGANDLGWDVDEVIEEGPEVHAEEAILLGCATASRLSDSGEHQRRPRLETLREASHHHVRPVGVQTIRRGPKRSHAIFKLLDQVLLMASISRLLDDLFGRDVEIVDDV